MEIKIVTLILLSLVAMVAVTKGLRQDLNVHGGRAVPPKIHWGYGESLNGPDTWHELFHIGQNQSPIDIRPDETFYDPLLKEFVILSDPPTPRSKFRVLNNGHSIKVKTEGDFYLYNGGLNDNYSTDHFHFHWGDDSQYGSEHTIDGVEFPLEMHIVSWNTNMNKSFSGAAKQPGGLAVLSILFEIGPYDNPVLEHLVNVIHQIRDPDWHKVVDIPCVCMRNFLPRDSSRYYRYNGSLTSPNAYESVIWTIFEKKQTISERQLDVFRQVLTSAHHDGKSHATHESGIGQGHGVRERLVNNYRPVQPLNGRLVYRSFPVVYQPL